MTTNEQSTGADAPQEPSKIAIIVMGVAGSGKSTIAELLGARLGWVVADADDFHPAGNIVKMRSGLPLTDADREPWLAAIRDFITGAQGNVVIACSALRRAYRDVLRQARAQVRFLHLTGARDVIGGRIESRMGHFMPEVLLDSQLATLEPLQADEHGVAILLAKTPAEIVQEAACALDLRFPEAL